MSGNLIKSFRNRRSLLIVVTAAILIELLSGAQYLFTHRMMEEELERRAGLELTLKAILTTSTLQSAETIMRNHLWDIQEHLGEPDSAYATVKRMMQYAPHLLGAGVSFEPDCYPSKERLFQVYARRKADRKVEFHRIGGPGFDYTKTDIYQEAIASDGIWRGPILNDEGTLIESYLAPVRGKAGTNVGVANIDISLEWLSDTLDRRHIYPSSFILLLTTSGKPLVWPSESRISKATSDSIFSLINDSTVVRGQSLSGRSKVIYFEIDNRKGTVFYATMKKYPHVVIAVVCYDDEVYAPLQALRLWLLLFSMLAFGILLYMVLRYMHGEKRLQQTMLQKERIDGELRIASGIQQTILPAEEASLQGVEEVCVVGRLIPARAVGGDLYNYFVRHGKLFFCIGDVSGKGVPAAIIMAITQVLFRDIAMRESDPSHIMSQLNQAACRGNKSCMFATMFVGVLDLPTGRLRYCNGGHEVPVLLRAAEESGAARKVDVSMLNCAANMPIGLFEDVKYEMQETLMPPDSILCLYTDGLTEARDANKKQLGRKRALQMIADSGVTDAKLLVDAVVEGTLHFSEGTEQSDDLTLLAIKYSPVEKHFIFDKQLTLYNDVKEVTQLSSFVKATLQQLGIAKSLAAKLRLAVEEAVVNVMEYAYPPQKRGEVNIRITYDGERLQFIITDSGVAFNPTETAVADTTLSAEERPVGGLGILLVRELMDSTNYERIDHKNVLTLTKRVECSEMKV